MLHIINKSPGESDQLTRCLEFINEGDGLIFIENGVYTTDLDKLPDKLLNKSTIKLCVLGPDLEARGLDKQKIVDHYQIIDYTGFVRLVTEYPVIQSW